MPHSRPMPSIGARWHELRVNDRGRTWRIFYRLDPDSVVIAAVAEKKARKTPKSLLGLCRRRPAQYDQDQEEST